MEKTQKGLSLGSADELHERRKKEGLPLAMFLSFNDRDVHPNCPNASNPYHKCGRHCLHKILPNNMLLYTDRSGGSSSDGERLERKGVNPTCPNASNPYHKCADYCFEKLAEKRWDVGKVAGRRVNPECKNASNPYHVCAEYCFQGTPVMAKPGHGTKPEKPKERKNIVSNADKRGVNPNCRCASNPYHKCAEYCFQNVPEVDIPRGVRNKKKKSSPGKERIGEYPFKERSMESEHAEASTSSHDSEDSLKIIAKNVGTDQSEHDFSKKAKEEELSAVELSDTQPLPIDVVDLFEEWAKYCSLKASEENETKQDITRQRI